MLSVVVSKQSGTLASVAFADAYTDFELSRQAMQCTKATMEFYRYTAAKFLTWAEGKGAREPKQIDAYLVRQYLAGLAGEGRYNPTWQYESNQNHPQILARRGIYGLSQV